MAAGRHIANPFEYLLEKLSWTASDIGRASAMPRRRMVSAPAVRKIAPADLWDALRKGLDDLAVNRADVLFIGVIYPVAGLLLAQMAFSRNLLPLIFPLVSGFALLGPVAAVGLYEISRRRERGQAVSWRAASDVLRSPGLDSILAMGAVLLILFAAWIGAAYGIYALTLGPQPPASAFSFFREVLATPAGWAMILIGCAVGALFAATAMAVSVVSIPLLLDRDVGLGAAIGVSLKAVAANPGTMALWGLVVGGALVAGSIPALVGLIFVMPLLGHATWHLYRKVVV